MAPHIAPAQVVRHASDWGWSEFAMGEPDPRLRPYVHGSYVGYVERTSGPLRRRELPGPQVVLIIDFGPPLRILDPRDARPVSAHPAGFVAGLGDSFTLTETAGTMSGIQVDFTPVGARLLLGLPMHHLTNQTVGLEDLFGAEGPRLRDRLQETPGWEARFALLDGFILSRIHGARAVSDCVAWAWGRLHASRGQVEIGALAEELGYSQKHLIARFHEELGLTPKLLARILRFDGVIQRVKKAGAAGSWGQIALDAGYYDQAHLIRDFRQFTGGPPGEFLRRLNPNLGGVSGD